MITDEISNHIDRIIEDSVKKICRFKKGSKIISKTIFLNDIDQFATGIFLGYVISSVRIFMLIKFERQASEEEEIEVFNRLLSRMNDVHLKLKDLKNG